MGDMMPVIVTRGGDPEAEALPLWVKVVLFLLVLLVVAYFVLSPEEPSGSLLSPPMPWKDWRG